MVGGAGNGWGVRVRGGRGPVQEGVAGAAIVGVRLALLERKARRKAGCLAGRGMDSRFSWGEAVGAVLGVVLSSVAVRPRAG